MGNNVQIQHTDEAGNNTDANELTELNIDLDSLLEIFSQLEKIKMNAQAQSMTTNKINMKTDFKIFVGIDFGTNGCGIAYAINKDTLQQHKSQNDEKNDDSSDSSDDSEDPMNNSNDNDEGVQSDGYIIIPHQWNDLAIDNSKLNTCILLDDKNMLQVMGNSARIQYTDMQKNNWKLFDNFKMSLYNHLDDEFEEKEEIKDDHKGNDMVGNEVNDKKYIALKHRIKSCDGSITEADIVFCATLKYLKQEALKYISERIGIKEIEVDDIQWILTIPALWDNSSKHMMRQWGLASGLVNKDITNHLKIVLEPECASLQIQHEFHHHKTICFNKNDKYILVDAGGGTVDIVAHEIYSDFGVKELIASFGGAYGSINIDNKFNELFDTLFTKHIMDEFRANNPKQYVKLIENVVWAKRQFYSNGEQAIYQSIDLDMTFYGKIRDQSFDGKNLSKYLKSIDNIFGVSATDLGIEGIDNKKKKQRMFRIDTCSIDYAYLEIHKNVWKMIFDEKCLNDIIRTIKSIMHENNISNDIKYIFMAGGLSQSKYFQIRMSDEFEPILIVAPQNPLLSVVCGAARYGYKTDFIHTRILKKTYAVRVTQRYSTLMLDHKLRDTVNYIENYHDGDEKDDEHEAFIAQLIEITKNDENNDDFKDNMSDTQLRKLLCDKIKPELDEVPIPKEWIEANHTYNPMTKELVCTKLLSILATKGDQIEINSKDKITRTYKRWTKDQTISTIEIYASDKKHPLTIDDATKLCEGQLIYPDIGDDAQDEDALDVICEVSFDDSLLIAYVYPKNNPEQRAEVALEYQTN